MNTKILFSGAALLSIASSGMRLVDSPNAPVYLVGSIVLTTIWLAVKFK